MVTPDIDGYKAALLRKREGLGQQVVFHFPQTPAYPDGTVLDPKTGRPYDPLIEPTSSEGEEPVTMSLSVAFRHTFQEDTDETEIGDIKLNLALTWVTLEEWEEVEEATSFDYMGDNYDIRKTTHEAIGGEAWRVLIWGERQAEEGQV